jgi:hypothetical protein
VPGRGARVIWRWGEQDRSLTRTQIAGGQRGEMKWTSFEKPLVFETTGAGILVRMVGAPQAAAPTLLVSQLLLLETPG